MAITYDAPSNTITVTGYTEATPCTMLDLWNADQAGGWGVITRQCTDQYCIGCKNVIGNGSTETWFADEGVQIIVQHGILSADFERIFDIKLHAHIRFGKVLNAGIKTSENGCSFRVLETTYQTALIRGVTGTNGADVQLYSNIFTCESTTMQYLIGECQDSKMWNNLFQGYCYLYRWYNCDYYNNSHAHGKKVLEDCGGTFNVMRADTFTYVLFADFALFTGAENVLARNYTYLFRHYQASVDADAIDFDVPSWTFSWYQSSTVKLNRKYHFDLKVTDKDENAISGAAVKIWDKDNTLVVNVTTGADGKIATQTLNYGYYTEAGGDTPTMQTPHTIEISKAGYQTYKKKFTVDEKISWRIRLLQAKPVQFLDNEPILQLCPESQEDDSIVFAAL